MLKISSLLVDSGHEVLQDQKKWKSGDNLFEKVNESIHLADVCLIVLSKNSITSKVIKKELSTMILSQISKRSKRIIPLLLEKLPIPTYLAQYAYLDLSNNIDEGINKLLCDLKNNSDSNKINDFNGFVQERNYTKQIEILSKELKAGRLTLVCGAGTSIGAGVPSWNLLLQNLLEIIIKKLAQKNSITNNRIIEFNQDQSYSSLVIGKFLKNNLGTDFNKEVRDALYRTNPTTSRLIDAIVNLSRPQRDGKPLDSIITFNFDSLIEENLERNNIPYKPIYSEGMRNKSKEIPIYHVHGYLPRKGRITQDNAIVFSEDSYHSQFIESFSWSNLVQLNTLNQNTCLLIGLSMSDPNLRRLLDVAFRKTPDGTLRHFIIKQLPKNRYNNFELSKFLEEQDANGLGLNVLWIENFDEIETILNNINHL